MARRFHRIRHHARRHGGRMAAGWKGSAASAAAGVGTGIALPYVSSTIPFLQTAGWWAMPGALLLVGHFLKRKNPAIGGALLGIGGMSLYSAYQGSKTTKGYPSSTYADAGGTAYSDNIRTDAAPSLGTAQAAALLNANPQQTMGMVDAGYAESGDAGGDDAYGLID